MSRNCFPRLARKKPIFVVITENFAILASKRHCCASKYIRKSKVDMLLASIRSRYGLFVTESRGSCSWFLNSGWIKEPNQNMFRSFERRWNMASNSLYGIMASSKMFIPSNELAKLSYECMSFPPTACRMWLYLQDEKCTKIPARH